ncbi:DUF4032 domain-containing protein [Arsenicicoccus dermatophilus]|uniref:DUF4032 domain-containing protein n=1 Tax=Arsenicicoccus dermatophilus TaxID=1076331 RepID=UPI001F4C656F|nr:DUF4032 domain-containing protein [Arsenicicoccus dermatophilus]MCH8611999.1 DUF4032 domain-containing protein [Arsenicicoccus dermatophilus]
MALEITAARPDPALLDLPWTTPLEEWPESILAALPRGISRHTVRFVRVPAGVVAIKEIKDEIAWREYHMLRALNRLQIPAVRPYGVVSGRVTEDGTPLDACLLTHHLQFSLPFRALFSQSLRPDTATRLIDALAVLLVRLHLQGFWWGDVSLSNALFRRDAGAFAAYLVDAETGELRDELSNGQREHDLDIARINIAGELMDLEAGGVLPEGNDPVEVSDQIMQRYRALWQELTGLETFTVGERWRVDERIRRLNEIGFDVDELAISTDIDGTTLRIQPKVVDAGHHSRRLLRLTGLDVEENQARRLLNDLDAYRAATDVQGEDEAITATRWLNEIYLPVTRAIPDDLRGKLEPAEMFHEILEHRWYLSEHNGHDMPIGQAMADYIMRILPTKPRERTIVGVDTVEMPVVAWDG